MASLSARIRLVALLGAQVTAVAVLQRLGAHLAVEWSDLSGWIAVTAPADAAVAVLRYVGLAVGWWLLATTTMYLLARLTDLPAPLVARLTLPGVRRTVERAVAAGAAASLLLTGSAPAMADPVVPPPVVAPPETTGAQAPADEVVVPPAVERPVGLAPLAPGAPDAAGRPVEPAPLAPPAAEGRGATPVGQTAEHVVAPGEHLWGIAEAAVAAAQGRTASELTADVIAPYWLELVAANCRRLRSGDPDLIYPGERLVLPPL